MQSQISLCNSGVWELGRDSVATTVYSSSSRTSESKPRSEEATSQLFKDIKVPLEQLQEGRKLRTKLSQPLANESLTTSNWGQDVVFTGHREAGSAASLRFLTSSSQHQTRKGRPERLGNWSKVTRPSETCQL